MKMFSVIIRLMICKWEYLSNADNFKKSYEVEGSFLSEWISIELWSMNLAPDFVLYTLITGVWKKKTVLGTNSLSIIVFWRII